MERPSCNGRIYENLYWSKEYVFLEPSTYHIYRIWVYLMSVKGITATQKIGKIKSERGRERERNGERERERECVLDKNEDFNGIKSADWKD